MHILHVVSAATLGSFQVRNQLCKHLPLLATRWHQTPTVARCGGLWLAPASIQYCPCIFWDKMIDVARFRFRQYKFSVWPLTSRKDIIFSPKFYRCFNILNFDSLLQEPHGCMVFAQALSPCKLRIYYRFLDEEIFVWEKVISLLLPVHLINIYLMPVGPDAKCWLWADI